MFKSVSLKVQKTYETRGLLNLHECNSYSVAQWQSTCIDKCLIHKTPRIFPHIWMSYLFKSQGALVQAMADLSLTASDARVAFLNILQAKSHSSTPPKAMALQ